MVAGFNNSAGFYDNREGLSGYAYSVNGGNTWVDGRGLPPVVPGGGFLAPGHDQYEGDPVLAVDKTPRARERVEPGFLGSTFFSTVRSQRSLRFWT